jgi:hypothetical protein
MRYISNGQNIDGWAGTNDKGLVPQFAIKCRQVDMGGIRSGSV